MLIGPTLLNTLFSTKVFHLSYHTDHSLWLSYSFLNCQSLSYLFKVKEYFGINKQIALCSMKKMFFVMLFTLPTLRTKLQSYFSSWYNNVFFGNILKTDFSLTSFICCINSLERQRAKQIFMEKIISQHSKLQFVLLKYCTMETGLHLFFECTYAKRVWELSGMALQMGDTIPDIWDYSWSRQRQIVSKKLIQVFTISDSTLQDAIDRASSSSYMSST